MLLRLLFGALCICCLILNPGIVNSADGKDLQETARTVRWRRLPLLSKPPADLDVDVSHMENTARFAEWVYGTPDSPRVAIAVLDSPSGERRMYVDRNRDRRIEERDLASGDGELFGTQLDAAQVDGFYLIEYSRDVLLRFRHGNRKGDTDLSVATVTRPRHVVRVDDSKQNDDDVSRRTMTVQQVDVDANGLFANAKDQLQIDLNEDGKFSPFLETFPFRPVMKIRNERWFIKADRFGQRLRLESASATGSVRISARSNSKPDSITGIVLTLAGEDGSVYTLSGIDRDTDLPVGRYAPSVLFVTLHPEGGRKWSSPFSRNGQPKKAHWIDVKEGGSVPIDPIGKLSLTCELEKTDLKTGQCRVQPQLFTESGLLINLCEQEGVSTYAGPKCYVGLTGTAGQPIDQSRSGFA